MAAAQNQNGMNVINILRDLNEPASVNQIKQRFIKITGINTPQITKTVELALEDGIMNGYIQKMDDKYFVSDMDPQVVKNMEIANDAVAEEQTQMEVVEEPVQTVDDINAGAAFVSPEEYYRRASKWRQHVVAGDIEPEPIAAPKQSEKQNTSDKNPKKVTFAKNYNFLVDDLKGNAQVVEVYAENQDVVHQIISELTVKEKDFTEVEEKNKSRSKRLSKCKPIKPEKRKRSNSRNNKITKYVKKANHNGEESPTNESDEDDDSTVCKKVSHTMDVDVACLCDECINFHLDELECSEHGDDKI